MGTRVGRYLLFETIGRGSFGKVKLGVDTESGEQVAVKILSKELIKTHGLETQVRREIAILKTIKHQNVVNLHTVLASKSKLYIIMDLVTGGELFEIIANEGHDGLKEKDARKYFQMLIDGVHHCHKRGIIHRDIKPENLLLSDDGQLKLTDFGLSSIRKRDTESGDRQGGDSMNLMRTQCGTPSYVPPEVITVNAQQDGGGYNGEVVDAWACGILLYAMLTGYLPFDGDDLSELFVNIQSADVDYPDSMNPSAVDLIKKLLDRDPKKRYDMKMVKKHPWFLIDYEGDDSVVGKKKRREQRRMGREAEKKEDEDEEVGGERLEVAFPDENEKEAEKNRQDEDTGEVNKSKKKKNVGMELSKTSSSMFGCSFRAIPGVHNRSMNASMQVFRSDQSEYHASLQSLSGIIQDEQQSSRTLLAQQPTSILSSRLNFGIHPSSGTPAPAHVTAAVTEADDDEEVHEEQDGLSESQRMSLNAVRRLQTLITYAKYKASESNGLQLKSESRLQTVPTLSPTTRKMGLSVRNGSVMLQSMTNGFGNVKGVQSEVRTKNVLSADGNAARNNAHFVALVRLGTDEMASDTEGSGGQMEQTLNAVEYVRNALDREVFENGFAKESAEFESVDKVLLVWKLRVECVMYGNDGGEKEKELEKSVSDEELMLVQKMLREWDQSILGESAAREMIGSGEKDVQEDEEEHMQRADDESESDGEFVEAQGEVRTPPNEVEVEAFEEKREVEAEKKEELTKSVSGKKVTINVLPPKRNVGNSEVMSMSTARGVMLASRQKSSVAAKNEFYGKLGYTDSVIVDSARPGFDQIMSMNRSNSSGNHGVVFRGSFEGLPATSAAVEEGNRSGAESVSESNSESQQSSSHQSNSQSNLMAGNASERSGSFGFKGLGMGLSQSTKMRGLNSRQSSVSGVGSSHLPFTDENENSGADGKKVRMKSFRGSFTKLVNVIPKGLNRGLSHQSSRSKTGDGAVVGGRENSEEELMTHRFESKLDQVRCVKEMNKVLTRELNADVVPVANASKVGANKVDGVVLAVELEDYEGGRIDLWIEIWAKSPCMIVMYPKKKMNQDGSDECQRYVKFCVDVESRFNEKAVHMDAQS